VAAGSLARGADQVATAVMKAAETATRTEPSCSNLHLAGKVSQVQDEHAPAQCWHCPCPCSRAWCKEYLQNDCTAAHLCCVDDAHVHAAERAPVQEGGVERAPDGLVAAEAERDVAHPAADLAARAYLLQHA
jgi:hypothetical protein